MKKLVGFGVLALVASVGSVAWGAAAPIPGVPAIDARGMTVMPGFIDAHRHIIGGGAGAGWMQTEAQARMQEFLDAGFTTLVSAGDGQEQILELRRRTA